MNEISKPKLKTLKEIQGFMLPYEQERTEEAVDVFDIREEAINWIKFYEWIKPPADEKSGRDGLIKAQGAIEFIKHFFNISEEELQ